jgi:hypothetical protein
MNHDRFILPLGGIVACGIALCLSLVGWVVLSSPGPNAPAPAVQDSPEQARLAEEGEAFRPEFEQALTAARRAAAQGFYRDGRTVSPTLGAAFLTGLYAEAEQAPALVPVVTWLRTLPLDAEPHVAAAVLLTYTARLERDGRAPRVP